MIDGRKDEDRRGNMVDVTRDNVKINETVGTKEGMCDGFREWDPRRRSRALVEREGSDEGGV